MVVEENIDVDANLMKDEINGPNNSYSPSNSVDKNELKQFLTNFKLLYDNATIKGRRQLLRTFMWKL